MDQQLPPAMVEWLQARGHEAEHVRNIGLKDADDAIIWRHAESLNATIVTKDEDFMSRRSRVSAGPAVVWLRLGNATTPDLLAWLDSKWREIEAALVAGDAVVEVR